MALYRTGTASLSADGVITGQGTKWRDPLTLIRTGATIIFLGDEIKLAVISDIISDTEMRAITTDGATATESKYVILLNDSLTVDGMAQDVAETLRYYQSKETVIEEALDFFRDFDLEGLKKMVEQVLKSEANAKQSETNAKNSEMLAEDFKNETEQIKNETQSIKDGAVGEITTAKDNALQEVGTTKESALSEISTAKETSLQEMEVVKQETFDARDEAESAEMGANQAKADSETAKTDAEKARDKAKEYADSIDPISFLKKENNLQDLADRAAAWLNVRPDGPTSLSAEPVEDMDSATMGWVKKFVASVKSVIQSWSVINADATAPANGTTVKGGALRSVYKVGSTEQAAAELLASLTTSSTGVKAVSAEVVVKDSTSGTTTSKTIKLGTIDGLTGGIISSSTSIGGTTSVVQHNSFVSDGKTYHQGGKTYGYLSDSTSSPGTRYWALWNEYVEGGAGYIQLLFNIGSLQKYWTFYDSGNAAASGTWNSNSDGRLKIRVKRVEDPLVKMRVMQGATWDRLDGAPSGQGFIAQEVEKVFPDAVSVTGDRKLEDGTLITGVKSVDVAGVAAALHHESILQLMDIVKEAITTIAGVTTDESAKAALKALAERIPAPDTQ